ncbi:MAG TPA: ester cyclase family protein, partial [Kofleriaceae bacterium]|nr:ester cyclase family protein [Kofleriaceae bacterium]
GKELARTFIDCAALISTARWEDYGTQCLAASFVGHHADEPDVTRDEMIPRLTAARVAFPDLVLEPQLVLVSGRTVLGVLLMKGTNGGPLRGEAGELPATKQKIGVLMYERVAMDDENKATEQWAYFDPATMLGQLGHQKAMPTRPPVEGSLPDAPIVAVAADDDRERANLAIVRRGNEAFNAKKAADLMALFADDAIEADQATPGDVKGKPAIEQALRGLWKAFPDARGEISSTWAAGDHVVAELRFTGTHDGPLGGLPRTGKKVAFQYAEIFKLKDGKIVELWRFRNGIALAQQLGAGGPAKGAAPAR